MFLFCSKLARKGETAQLAWTKNEHLFPKHLCSINIILLMSAFKSLKGDFTTFKKKCRWVLFKYVNIFCFKYACAVKQNCIIHYPVTHYKDDMNISLNIPLDVEIESTVVLLWVHVICQLICPKVNLSKGYT